MTIDAHPTKRAGAPAILVAGGGLAGAALATHLAMGGRRVLLFEKDRFPRDKLCGEFLSPESEQELERLGVLDRVRALGPAEIRRSRFTSAAGHVLEADLPRAALGVSRRRLDAILFARALAAGAEAEEDVEVVSVKPSGARFVVGLARGADRSPDEVEVDLVLLAHGRRGRLDRTLDRPFMRARSAFAGVKRHHRPRPASTLARDLVDHVEIHAFEGGYCGLSFVEDGVVNVCALLEEAFFSALGSTSWDAIVRTFSARNGALARRLAALEPLGDDFLSVGQVAFASKERSKDGVLFVGDAAGMIAPFAGDGQAMALTSARILADLILAEGTDPSRWDRSALARRWDRAWRIHFEPRMKVGRALQPLLFRAEPADLLLRTIGLVPGLSSALVRLTRGG